MARNWCPLCKVRFRTKSQDDVVAGVVKIIEDGTISKQNFKTLELAIKNDPYAKEKPMPIEEEEEKPPKK